MNFKIVDHPGRLDIDIHFAEPSSVGVNLAALDRLINYSGLSFRRVAEVLGVSDVELEETLRDLAENGDIEMAGNLPEHIEKEFLAYVRSRISYWDARPNHSTCEKLEGLAFSILAALDGSAGALPAFIVAPRSLNEGIEVRGDIAGGLHEALFAGEQDE